MFFDLLLQVGGLQVAEFNSLAIFHVVLYSCSRIGEQARLCSIAARHRKIRSTETTDGSLMFYENVFSMLQKSGVRVTAKGITIPVVSLRHLKELKKAAARPQDLADIEAIETMEREEKR